MQTESKQAPLYAVVAAVQLPGVDDVEFEASLTELRELAKTLGYMVVRTFIQKRAGFDTTAYLGVGKREEIRRFVNGEPDSAAEYTPAASTPDPVDAVFVDHEISPSQARHLENEVGCPVMDRTMVILEISHRNARSPAARAQVEIARLGYMAPRQRLCRPLYRARRAGTVCRRFRCGRQAGQTRRVRQPVRRGLLWPAVQHHARHAQARSPDGTRHAGVGRTQPGTAAGGGGGGVAAD
jgi:50S ribosomal subunit-associated GTPase HflX